MSLVVALAIGLAAAAVGPLGLVDEEPPQTGNVGSESGPPEGSTPMDVPFRHGGSDGVLEPRATRDANEPIEPTSPEAQKAWGDRSSSEVREEAPATEPAEPKVADAPQSSGGGAGMDATPPPSSGSASPTAAGDDGEEREEAPANEPAREPVDEPHRTVWAFSQSSSGDGNSESITATFTAIEAAEGWRSTCSGEKVWTPYDGEPERSSFSGEVTPRGFRPTGPVDATSGAEVFLPDWFPADGCAGYDEAHLVEVVGRETRTFRIGGDDRQVEVWKGVVPERDGEPVGRGAFYWDAATGVLLEAAYDGLSGRMSSRVTVTTEPLAYR